MMIKFVAKVIIVEMDILSPENKSCRSNLKLMAKKDCDLSPLTKGFDQLILFVVQLLASAVYSMLKLF